MDCHGPRISAQRSVAVVRWRAKQVPPISSAMISILVHDGDLALAQREEVGRIHGVRSIADDEPCSIKHSPQDFLSDLLVSRYCLLRLIGVTELLGSMSP